MRNCHGAGGHVPKRRPVGKIVKFGPEEGWPGRKILDRQPARIVNGWQLERVWPRHVVFAAPGASPRRDLGSASQGTESCEFPFESRRFEQPGLRSGRRWMIRGLREDAVLLRRNSTPAGLKSQGAQLPQRPTPTAPNSHGAQLPRGLARRVGGAVAGSSGQGWRG